MEFARVMFGSFFCGLRLIRLRGRWLGVVWGRGVRAIAETTHVVRFAFFCGLRFLRLRRRWFGVV